MSNIDYADEKGVSEWDRLWSEKDVADEARNIDKQSTFFNIVTQTLTNLPQDAVILEGGCGLGRWLLHCESKYRIFGLDHSEPALRALREFSAVSCLACADVFHLPLKSEIIDCYLSFGVLEHFEGGPIEGLREAYRALKPGGILLITGPGSSPLSLVDPLRKLSRVALIRRLLHKPPIERGMYFFQYRFRPAEMRHFLHSVGFSNMQTILWGNLETLWQYFPPLRHRLTMIYGWYSDVIMSGTPFRLTGVGMILHKIIRRLTPWLFHYAWMIQAEKPHQYLEK